MLNTVMYSILMTTVILSIRKNHRTMIILKIKMIKAKLKEAEINPSHLKKPRQIQYRYIKGRKKWEHIRDLTKTSMETFYKNAGHEHGSCSRV